VVAVNPLHANYLTVHLGGEARRIWSQPHEPLFSVGTAQELAGRAEELAPVLPPGPFRMGGTWFVRTSARTLRQHADEAGAVELFSANGEWVARITPREPDQHGAVMGSLRLTDATGRVAYQLPVVPRYLTVSDDGSVTWAAPAMGGATFVIHGPDGVQRARRFVPLALDHPLAGPGLCPLGPGRPWLVYTSREVTAIDGTGEIQWRRQKAEGAGAGHFSERPVWDPLARGVVLQVRHSDLTTSVLFIDPATGVVTGSLWQQEARPLPSRISPQGKYAALVDSEGIGLLDWQTGRQVYRYRTDQPLEGRAFSVHPGNADAVSDEGSLSVGLTDGKCWSVFDHTGRRFWYCDVRAGRGYWRTWMSPEGDRLALVCTDPMARPGEGPEVYGVLVYRVEA
jgi:hypothetical protein